MMSEQQVSKKPKRRLEIVRAGVLLETDFGEPKWLWKGWIPRGKVGMVAAVSDHGKTALILQLAAAVASGKPFLGVETTPKPCGAIIYSLEDDPEDFSRRLPFVLEGMEAQKMVSNRDKICIGNNLWIAYPSYEVADMSFEKTEGEICAYLGTMRKEGVEPALVVVETLSAVSDGDERQTHSTRSLWAAARKIAKTENVTVIITHHYRKEGNGKGNRTSLVERVQEDAMRGAGANGGAARFVLQMGLPTPDEAEGAGLDHNKALNKDYAVLRASKLKASKPDMLFLERVEEGEPGSHTWVARPDGSEIIANLMKSSTRRSNLDLQDKLLVAILKQGMSPDREKLKSLFSGQKDSEKALSNALNRLRNLGDLVPKALVLTPSGREKAVSLSKETGIIWEEDESCLNEA